MGRNVFSVALLYEILFQLSSSFNSVLESVVMISTIGRIYFAFHDTLSGKPKILTVSLIFTTTNEANSPETQGKILLKTN